MNRTVIAQSTTSRRATDATWSRGALGAARCGGCARHLVFRDVRRCASQRSRSGAAIRGRVLFVNLLASYVLNLPAPYGWAPRITPHEKTSVHPTKKCFMGCCSGLTVASTRSMRWWSFGTQCLSCAGTATLSRCRRRVRTARLYKKFKM